MPTRRLSDRLLPSLTRQARERGRRLEIMDSGAGFQGFGIRISPVGAATFFVRWTWHGQRNFQKLGRYGPAGVTLAEARESAREIRRQVERGEDPLAAQRLAAGAPTFDELAEHYIRHITTRPKPLKSSREVQRIINVELRPTFGDRKANDISRAEFQRHLRTIAERRPAPVMANRVLATLSAMYSFGLDHEDLLQGLMTSTPYGG